FKNFTNNEDSITEYLSSRLDRTIDVSIEPDEISKIAGSIKKVLSEIEFERKKLGVMVLAVIQDDSPYFLVEPGSVRNGDLILGNSCLNPGLLIVADTKKLLS